MSPFLLIYGFLIGYLLFYFNFSQYFIWYIAIIIYFLSINYSKQSRLRELAILTCNEDQKEILDKSTSNTLKFYLLSSVIYVAVFIVSFMYFYNS